MATFEGWAILEVMGHRRLAGHVSEATIAGAAMLRIDIPGKEHGQIKATQYYSGSSIFSLTPTTEELARKEANPTEWQPLQLGEGGDVEDDCDVDDEEV